MPTHGCVPSGNWLRMVCVVRFAFDGRFPSAWFFVSDTSEKNSGKGTPLPWVILSGFLGIFAIGTPAVNNAAKPREPEKKEAPADPTPFRISGKNPLKPVYDFYATHDGRWDPEDDLRRNLHNFQVEFLIATVPDPIDTPYGYAFDQVVDAIQRAVEKKNGYVLDRSWLPWEIDKKPKSGKGDDADKIGTNYREAFPGVLLFRHSKHADKKINHAGLCMVFLVGETPMGGLNKRAFTQALKMMASAGHSTTEPVRIIGPYFSGSQTSLQFVIGDWWAGVSNWSGDVWTGIKNWPPFNPMFRFDVISGNATALNFNDYFKIDPYADGQPAWQADKFSLSATVIPTKTVISAMLRYLTRRDGCRSNEPIAKGISHIPGKVALLTESNTGFGKSLNSINRQDILMLRFPLHISHVKTEYTQAFRKKDEQEGVKHDDLLVPSRFEEAHPASEGVPSQGGATTTAVNAQVLSNILATIVREQCRYVGVVASDTRDKLFLIRLIREFCPDVHVFVTDADQLLLHPDYRYHMRGVIVGSTYPLLAQNQRWVKPDERERILFATVGAQGCYNATAMHLGLYKELLEYAPPTFVERDAGDDAQSLQRPPIWISVVSPNGTMVPLQVFTEYDDSSHIMRLNPQPAGQSQHVPLTYPGAMLPVGVSLMAFWLFLIYQALFTRSSRMFWEPAGRRANSRCRNFATAISCSAHRLCWHCRCSC